MAAGLRAMVIAIVALLLGAPRLAAAALGDFPLITYNMQGATSGQDSKWTTTIAGYIARTEIVALQEVGPTPPPSAPGTAPQLIPLNVPGLPQAGNAGFVQHTQWRSGFANYEVYFLQTDQNGGTYVGGRTNVALVTQRAADEVTAVANPVGRAALGVRFGDTWYFTYHARSYANNEAPVMVTDIANFVANRNQGEHWVVLGDFNRDPGSFAPPPGARTYNSGYATQQSGGELDYMIASENVNGIQVNRLAGASADHYAVALGQLRAAAEPQIRYQSDRAVESMQAGGVLDAYHEGTGNSTEIISWHRDGGANQAWSLEFYQDNTLRFRGRGSDRCIDIHNSNTAEAGRELVLWDCTGQDSQRWFAESVGDSELLIHSYLRPDLCMDIEGAPDSPDKGSIIVWPCVDEANQRWLFTPADATAFPDFTPIDLAANYPLPSTVENMQAGGVLDAFHENTGNWTDIISYHRTGHANQGWSLDWYSSNQVRLRGQGSNRCIDVAHSDTIEAGRELVLWDCTDQASQQWRAEPLINGQLLLHNMSRPDLCMDIAHGNHGPDKPDQGKLIVWPCQASENQQWLFTSYDPTGTPEPEHPHDEL